jgi:hypothetical protein
MEGVPFTEYADKVAMIGAIVIKPLEVTENGTYTAEEGEAFNPVTVDVPIPKVKPFTFTENGVYDVADGEVIGANPITVDIKQDLSRGVKAIIEFKKTADNLFYGARTITSEEVAELIKYDVTENATSAGQMYQQCDSSGFTAIPLSDMRKVQRANYFAYFCYYLKTIPALDFRELTTCTEAFRNCSALKEVWIKNIKCNMTIGSGNAYGHLLTVESLIHLIYQLRDTGSSKTFTIGNANLDKLANVYVRLVEITDEMRAEDDLIDEKLPFEVCESTDEGAIQIVEYAKLKNWNIA